MPAIDMPAAAPVPTDDNSQRRWAEMLGSLAALLPDSCQCVLVDGPEERAAFFAARLAAKLAGARRSPVLVTLDPGQDWDVSISLRTAPGGRHFPVYQKDAGNHDKLDRRERDERADIVVELHD